MYTNYKTQNIKPIEIDRHDIAGGVGYLTDDSEMHWTIECYGEEKITMTHNGEVHEFTTPEDARDWAMGQVTGPIDTHTISYDMYNDMEWVWDYRDAIDFEKITSTVHDMSGKVELARVSCETCGGNREYLEWVCAKDTLYILHGFGCYSHQRHFPTTLEEANKILTQILDSVRDADEQLYTDENIEVFKHQLQWIFKHYNA